MIRLLIATALAIISIPTFAADIGLSISVGEPGFYGRINIGDNPKPGVIYARPVIVQPQPFQVDLQPIYLRVPPGYERHWSRHCHEYHACGRPVYFVRNSWYRNSYAPRRREYEGDRDGQRSEYADERHEREHWRRHR